MKETFWEKLGNWISKLLGWESPSERYKRLGKQFAQDFLDSKED